MATNEFDIERLFVDDACQRKFIRVDVVADHFRVCADAVVNYENV